MAAAESSVPLLSDVQAMHPAKDFNDTAEEASPPPTTAPLPSYDDATEFEGLTLCEKKFLLINREIDANGMGRYQWYIWFLCGFGYLLDLLWAQAFGLVLGPLEQELGFSGNQSGNISSSFSAGLTAGAFVWGVLVDIVGRRWAFNLTCLISAAFGLGLGASNTYSTFLVITAFIGFGVGGNVPIDTTICLEFIPQNRRALLALLSIFQPIGVVVTCAIAYGYIPRYSCEPNFSEDNALKSCNVVPVGTPCCDKASNMGWRYLCYTLGGITLGVFLLRFVVFRFQESPKYLVYHGQDAKAIQVLEHIAKINRRECTLSLADFEVLQSEESSVDSISKPTDSSGSRKGMSFKQLVTLEFIRYRMLFQGWQMSYLTVLVWLTYICDFWGFTLAGTYLPQILAVKNSAIKLSLTFTYRSYIAIYAPGIVGVVVGAMMYGAPHFGRKWTMVISSGLMGASIFIFSSVNDEASNIGLNVMEYFFQSMFNAVLYGWTPEVFAAPIRGTACGIASFWGRLFSIIAPLSAETFIPEGGLAHSSPGTINQILYLAGGITLGCVITTALLPNKALGKQSL